MRMSRPCRAAPSRRVATLAPLLLVLAFTLSSCGDDSKRGESRSELEAELTKLSKFHQDDFRAGDTNKDLRLQDTELEAMLEEDFKSRDLDKDGEITEADIHQEAGKEVDAQASLEPFDLDKDGRVPIEEYAKHVERDFMKHMDTNNDGHLDPSEVSGFYGGQGVEAK